MKHPDQAPLKNLNFKGMKDSDFLSISKFQNQPAGIFYNLPLCFPLLSLFSFIPCKFIAVRRESQCFSLLMLSIKQSTVNCHHVPPVFLGLPRQQQQLISVQPPERGTSSPLFLRLFPSKLQVLKQYPAQLLPLSSREASSSLNDAKPDKKPGTKVGIKGREKGAMAYSVVEHVVVLKLMLSELNSFDTSESLMEWRNLHKEMCKN